MIYKALILLALFSTSIFAHDENKEKRTEGFFNDSEINMQASGGNSNIESYTGKTKSKYVDGKNVYQLGGHYNYGKSEEELSSRNWSAKLRYDRKLRDNLSLFALEEIEGDRFSGYVSRFNSDLGASYIISKSDRTENIVELSYRYTIEDRELLSEHVKDSKARVYLESSSNWSDSLKSKIWAEYIPNLSNSEDWISKFELSLENTLSSIFSLRFAYQGTYSNFLRASATKKYDYTYVTGLTARY